jgi:hypothetical protein
MQDIEPPALPFLFKLDAELRRSKFTVWRNISWHDGSEIPIFAFKNCWFLPQFSISLFVREVDDISVDNIKVFTEECFQYLQRNTTSKSKRTIWARPYLNILVLVSEHIAADAIDFVSQNGPIKKTIALWKLFAFPILINSNTRQTYYCKKKRLYGWMYYWLFHELVERFVVQNLP